MALALVPVVELEPTLLGISNFLELLDSGEWSAHWSSRLAALGSKPLCPGSWMVPVNELGDDALDLLLEQELDLPPEPAGPWRGVHPLPGGYAFVDRITEEIELEPYCCCDLADLRYWQAAADQDLGTSIRLCIGHGNYRFTRESDTVTVTTEPEHVGFDSTALVFTASEFQAALDQAANVQLSFRERVIPHLVPLVGAGAAPRIAHILTLGHRGPHPA